MGIIAESTVPNLILQVNVIQRQIYYKGVYKEIPDSYWKDEIIPKLYPLWDTDKDKLIVFTYFDTNTYNTQRRKFVKNFSTNEYVWKDYEMDQVGSEEGLALFELFKECFYLIDSIEKESFQNELANAYYDSKTVSWYGIRLARNFLLQDCDWITLSDSSLTEEEKELWKKYRQALRNVPQESGSEEAIDVLFPITPEDWKMYYKEHKPDEGYLESVDQYMKLAGHHITNMKERIFQYLMMKQSVMNPLNYKNYRDKMAELPPYRVPVPPELVKLANNEEQSSENVIDYLINTIQEDIDSSSQSEEQV
jgi:hypothetical protein